jgi:2-phospho-L-lactate/phosphoenolpyruvate guanylyltransferase
MPDAAVLAIVPVKALATAKGRLADTLGSTARQELAVWMLERVVRACDAATTVARLLVVAGDEQVADLARALGAQAAVQSRPGLQAALDLGDATAARLAARATLIIAADLPLATGADLDTLVRAAPDGPCVVVAPTGDGGTGAMLRRPSTVMPTAYGPGSADRHLAMAATRGIAAVRCDIGNLALDVDTAAALRDAAARVPELATLTLGWRDPDRTA